MTWQEEDHTAYLHCSAFVDISQTLGETQNPDCQVFLEVFHFFPPPVLFPSVVKKWTPPAPPRPRGSGTAWLYQCQRWVYTLGSFVLTFFFLICFNGTKRRALWPECVWKFCRIIIFFLLFYRVEEEEFWLTCHLVPFQMDWSVFFLFFFVTECHSRFRANLTNPGGIGGSKITGRLSLY